MDRRSFSKLLAGTVTAAGIHGINAAESKPALQKSSISDTRPVVAAIHGSWLFSMLLPLMPPKQAPREQPISMATARRK